eukprot:gene4965-6927_t
MATVIDTKYTLSEDGTKKVVEETLKEDDRIYKKTTTYRIDRIELEMPQRVYQRKNWKKFGLSAGKPEGPETATTIPCEDVSIEFTALKRAEEEQKKKEAEKRASQRSAPYRVPTQARLGLSGQSENPSRQGTGTYQAPRGRSSGMMMEEQPSLQINNLPTWTTDEDLRELCGSLGRVKRLYLAKDKSTQQARGFAYVDFELPSDALKALEKLDGYRYGPSILRCEWASKRK